MLKESNYTSNHLKVPDSLPCAPEGEWDLDELVDVLAKETEELVDSFLDELNDSMLLRADAEVCKAGAQWSKSGRS